jgi:hypothetical protein
MQETFDVQPVNYLLDLLLLACVLCGLLFELESGGDMFS